MDTSKFSVDYTESLHTCHNHRLYSKYSQRSTPTVIFIAGLGDSSETWSEVQDRISQETSTFSYDRAGVGKSQATSSPRTCRDLVEELEELLLAQDVEPPYILVGHSFGGLVARLYASVYPQFISGMVLVDAAPEYKELAYEKVLPKKLTVGNREYFENPMLNSEKTPHQYLFLLREWKRTGEQEALNMVERSLTAMYRGGIYDHLGYGFSRYSVDRYWLVPHFEKMLYDNALLAFTYLELFQATNKQDYAQIAEEVFDYVDRILTSPEGGFYCAEDADSEGEEGKFYVWNPLEIKEILGDKQGDIFCEYYDVTNGGNFEGKNVLNLIQAPSLSGLAKRKGLTEEELVELLRQSRQKLFAAREKRIHPHKDDKILTSWNGQMIAALAKGAAVSQKPEYAERAERASSFIEEKLSNDQGRLLARYRDGEANFLGYIDDYAYYTWGLHELYSATGDPKYLQRATALIQDTLRLFWDEEKGGFFFNAADSEQLFVRPKEFYDSALPSGNSVMAYNMIKQYRLTGDAKLEEYFDKLIDVFASSRSKALKKSNRCLTN